MEETPREKRNRRFLAYRERNPEKTYAQWLHEAAVLHVRTGSPHATLGGNLRKGDWWDAGVGTFERYRRLFAIEPDKKVVDYGCGSLRVGAHFIRYLDPGKYFGLDVTTGLVETGKELIGDEMLADKKPQFGAIEEKALAKAAKFGADFVCSTAVCYHVYPEEAPTYFGNLIRLCAKTGATLAFDMSLSDQPAPEHALSMPIDFYIEQLKPLEFVKFHQNALIDEGRQVLGIAEFRRVAPVAPPKKAAAVKSPKSSSGKKKKGSRR
jgi:SAM-dependent methyltransferase